MKCSREVGDKLTNKQKKEEEEIEGVEFRVERSLFSKPWSNGQWRKKKKKEWDKDEADIWEAPKQRA